MSSEGPSFDEIWDWPADRRVSFLGSPAGSGMLREYSLWADGCNWRGEGGRCGKPRLDQRRGSYCWEHFDLEDFDPAAYAREKAIKTRLRLAKMAETAVEVLAELLEDPGTPAAVREKAVSSVLDRAGVGRSVDVGMDVTVSNGERDEAARVVAERLRQLALPAGGSD